MPNQTVTVSAAHRRSPGTQIYHTDPECPRYPTHPITRQREPLLEDEDWRECKFCAGEFEGNLEQGPQLASKLMQMDGSEVFASD